MLTQMSDADWEIVVEVFRAARSRRGDKGRDDRKFMEALHFFTVHNITWRALPAEFGNWNSVWKRFWRLSQKGVFEAMLAILAGMSGTAHRWIAIVPTPSALSSTIRARHTCFCGLFPDPITASSRSRSPGPSRTSMPFLIPTSSHIRQPVGIIR